MDARFCLLLLLIAALAGHSGCSCGQEAPQPGPPETSAGDEPSEEWPEFPWPPPRASASADIPAQFLHSATAEPTTLGEIAQRLHESLEACGYSEKSYYAVPEGFAMVTRLEQMYADGRSKESDARWRTNLQPLKKFTLKEYLRALFTATPGYYRLIVFVSTSAPFAQTDSTVTRETATEWLHQGLNKLPAAIAALPFTEEHSCTALIYEFEQQQTGAEAILNLPSQLTGKAHLEKARLWQTWEH